MMPTMEDALAVNMDQFAELLRRDQMVQAPSFTTVSSEFREAIANAPIILAKGQANFETLGG